jgi:hypothetical protein
VVNLGLPTLTQPIATCYREGAQSRAALLATDIQQMMDFYQETLGVQVNVALAVPNSNDWRRVNPAPYGLPRFAGTPPVIFLPACERFFR